MAWFHEITAASPDPDTSLEALAALEKAWPVDIPTLEQVVLADAQFSLGFAHLMAISPISREKIQRSPSWLLWLADPAIWRHPRSRERMAVDAGSSIESAPETLRRFKPRELLRIAFREAGGFADIRESGLELANLAEICVDQIFEEILADCMKRWGVPQDAMTILGLGKLGGRELNFSSDIDLIFLHGEDGEVRRGFSNREFFARVGEKLLATFAASERDLFRVDMRLRPEGDTGPLVRSLDSMENYYAGYGETWERMALIKARPIAGSEELAYDFERILQVFVFPRSLSPDVLDEIAGVKARIEREIVGEEDLHRNVKLGRGGIREIEFIVQTLQILHGARFAFLQERSTLRTLGALTNLDLMPRETAESLRAAYIFLRAVEHRLQIVEEEQTHTLPSEPEEVARLARSLGFPDASALEERLALVMGGVRSEFEKVLGSRASNGTSSRRQDLSPFRDPSRAARLLDELGAGDAKRHVSPRTKRIYQRLEPLLLEQLGGRADPDLALTGFSNYVTAYGIRGLLYETLASNPKVLELLTKLFDSGELLSTLAIRRPQWIEEIARAPSFAVPMRVHDHLEALQTFESGRDPLEALRVYKQFQTLRLGIRDVLDLITLDDFVAENSALAEACAIRCADVLDLTGRLTVVAMGKFGGRELGYGADLDVVFLGESVDRARQFTQAMSAKTPEGWIFPVDARLRPEGASAPLAVTPDGYRAYLGRRAQLWEVQALTKARAIFGPDAAAFEAIRREAWLGACEREDLLEGVRSMHQRIVENRAKSADDVKTGSGGIMAIEFLCQALQMLHRLEGPSTLRTIEALAAKGHLQDAEAICLREAYLFLRRCEHVLRRQSGQSSTELPQDAVQRETLARRAGFRTAAELDAELESTRGQVEQIFSRYLPAA